MTNASSRGRPPKPTTALGDLTVRDSSHALAGPFASTMLAQHTCAVLKTRLGLPEEELEHKEHDEGARP